MSNRFGAFCRSTHEAFIESRLEARACPSGFVYFISDNGSETFVWKLRASNGSTVFRIDLRPHLSFTPSWPGGSRIQNIVLDADGSHLYFNSSRLVKVQTADGIPDVDRVVWESAQLGTSGLDIAADGDLRWGVSRVSAATGITLWGAALNRVVSAGSDNSMRSGVTNSGGGQQFIQKHDENGNLIWTHFLPAGPAGNVGNVEGVAVADNLNTWISYETRVLVGLNFKTRYFERLIDPAGGFLTEAAADPSIFGSAFSILPRTDRQRATWWYRPEPNLPRIREFKTDNAETLSTTDALIVPLAMHRGIADHFVARLGSFNDLARLSLDYQTEIWTIPISDSIDGFVRSIGSFDV